MYSMVLFMVDTSFSGFFGSGDRPTSASTASRRDDVVRHPAGELDVVREVELVAERDELVEAVAGPDQREADVVASELVDDDVGRPHDEVDAVLRSHDAE